MLLILCPESIRNLSLRWYLKRLSGISWNMCQFRGILFIYHRKIVHMPKTQIYDENGLFKGVGNLADRQIGQAVIGL